MDLYDSIHPPHFRTTPIPPTWEDDVGARVMPNPHRRMPPDRTTRRHLRPKRSSNCSPNRSMTKSSCQSSSRASATSCTSQDGRNRRATQRSRHRDRHRDLRAPPRPITDRRPQARIRHRRPCPRPPTRPLRTRPRRTGRSRRAHRHAADGDQEWKNRGDPDSAPHVACPGRSERRPRPRALVEQSARNGRHLPRHPDRPGSLEVRPPAPQPTPRPRRRLIGARRLPITGSPATFTGSPSGRQTAGGDWCRD